MLALADVDALLGATVSEKPKYLFIQSQAHPGETLVTISLQDGTVTPGPHFTQDEASRVFWAAIQAYGRAQFTASALVTPEMVAAGAAVLCSRSEPTPLASLDFELAEHLSASVLSAALLAATR